MKMCESTRKKCSKCGIEKPATPEYFFKNRNSRDGFRYICKACANDYNEKWRKEHPSYMSDWNKKHPDYMLDYWQKWYQKKKRKG